MKMHICDREACRKQAPPRDVYDLPPVGWHSLRTWDRQAKNRELEFCSTDCLANHVQALVLAELPALEPPAAQTPTILDPLEKLL